MGRRRGGGWRLGIGSRGCWGEEGGFWEDGGALYIWEGEIMGMDRLGGNVGVLIPQRAV